MWNSYISSDKKSVKVILVPLEKVEQLYLFRYKEWNSYINQELTQYLRKHYVQLSDVDNFDVDNWISDKEKLLWELWQNEKNKEEERKKKEEMEKIEKMEHMEERNRRTEQMDRQTCPLFSKMPYMHY